MRPQEVMEIDDFDDDLERIAIVGLAGRYPDAPDLEQFWNNLREGHESIRAFSEEELSGLGIPEEIFRAPKFVRMGTELPDMDRFDAGLFGYTPRQAEATDPQARILLETSYAALEHAGYDPFTYREPIGVFAGSNPNDYATLLGVAEPTDPAGAFDQLIGTEKDFLATRIAHRLDLKGPALNIQTACSTSLVAVHLACQSLLSYQCTMALAGGVAVNLRHGVGYFYQQGMISSPDGHCRAFDAEAEGTTLGQGCGVVVLKRLSEAIADGDTIHAIIDATAINNDGADKISYAAPSEVGQAEVIASALSLAGLGADDITYVETHGTGTPLGDPIEVAALTRAFSATTDRTGYCAIGSVKTNIGHTDAAAGITGLIKTVLALEHKELPPSLNFERPNPNIDFDGSPFFVNTELRPWESPGPRRAGVSSFGIGGTNAHAILEEAPAAQAEASRGPQLLTLSARTPAALAEMATNLAVHLERQRDVNLADVAHTLQVGRPDYEQRLIVVSEADEAASDVIRGQGTHRIFTTGPVTESTDVVFMFSGQGAQYPGMARDLYDTEPRFKEELDRCAATLEPLMGRDIRELLFPADGSEESVAELLRQTATTQPVLFAVEWSLAQLFMSWGVQPEAVVGHSIGEYVAATLAGIFTFQNALRLVVARGRLMQSVPEGSMLAVQASRADVERLLNDLSNASVELAAANSSRLVVVSGEHEAVQEFQSALTDRDIGSQMLHTSHAFHSRMMEPILEAFTDEVRAADPQAPELAILSNVTGTWMEADQATDAAFWASQIRSPVRFAENVSELLSRGGWTFLEVGPGRALATFVRQHDAADAATAVVTTVRHPQEHRSDRSVALESIGRLWQAGVAPDWEMLHGSSQRRRLPLPTYPFQRERYWAPEARHVLALGAAPPGTAADSPPRQQPMDDWFYIPSWRRAGPAPFAAAAQTWLVFGYGDQAAAELEKRLAEEGADVTSVTAGLEFEASESGYRIDPADDDHYDRLFDGLARDSLLPDVVVHLWAATALPAETVGDAQAALDLGVNSVQAIARGLTKQEATRPCRIEVVTAGAHSVTGLETVQPAASALLGPCKVIPLEYANLKCRNIDLGEPLEDSMPTRLMLTELQAEPTNVTVALRGRHRWTYDVAQVHIPEPDELPIKAGGVYLVVGGLGGVGLSIAGYLAETYDARLVLTGRSGRPLRVSGDGKPELERRLAELERIEQAAAGLLVLKADAADEVSMRAVRDEAQAAFGPIDGVIFAAAVIDTAGTIHRRKRSEGEEVVASKIHGAVVLERIFADRPLDFIVLSSSNTTMMYHNRFAQVGYVTANSFVEAAPYRMGNGTPVITVAWDDWLEIGMSVRAASDFSESHGYDGVTIQDPLHSFTPEEGVQIFARALVGGYPLVYVSKTDLNARMRRDVTVVSPFLERALADEGAATSAQSVHPGEGIEALTNVWRDLLGIETIDIDDDFFELGGDSLQVARMADRLSHIFGVTVPINLVFDAPSIAELHDRISALNGGDEVPAAASEQGVVTGSVPLSPGQLRFLNRGSPHPNHFNVAVLTRPHEPLQPELLGTALEAIVGHHDSLRLRIWQNDDASWLQRNEGLEGDHWRLHHIDLTHVPRHEQQTAVGLAAADLQKSLDLANGPITQVALFELGAGEQRLFLVVHHLASDRISMLQMLNDLQNAYQQLTDGAAVSLAAKTASFRRWTSALVEHAQSVAGADDLEYWLSLPWDLVAPIPRDHDAPARLNTNASASAITVKIGGEAGAALHESGAARADEVVLGALATALAQWTAASYVLIDTMGHGRRLFGSDIDISRTTGCFLTYSPLLLNAGPDTSLDGYVQQLRASVEQGWTWDALRFLAPEGPRQQELLGLPKAEVLFNFVGRPITADPDSLLVAVHEEHGDYTSPDGLRDHPLAVYVELTDDGVDLTVVYATTIHDESTVEALVARVVRGVGDLLSVTASGKQES